jgi:hypothetical protein
MTWNAVSLGFALPIGAKDPRCKPALQIAAAVPMKPKKVYINSTNSNSH